MGEQTAVSVWADLGNRAPGTVSSTPSTTRPVAADPTTLSESRALRAWAEQPEPAPIAATAEQIRTHLSFLAAALPAKSVDDETGKKRFAVYVSMLRGFTDPALAYMSRRACEMLDWFPTPRQCVDLAKEFQPGPSEKAIALIACNRFDQATFEAWRDAVRHGVEPGVVPPRWLEIAETQGLLRRLDNGRLVSRARYHGPRRPPSPVPGNIAQQLPVGENKP